MLSGGNDCQRNGEQTRLETIPLTIIPLTTPPRHAARQAGVFFFGDKCRHHAKTLWSPKWVANPTPTGMAK